MAERLTVVVTCDLCDAEAAEPGVRIAFGRRERVVDLCQEHYDVLADDLGAFLGAGRPVRGTIHHPRRRSMQAIKTRPEAQAIREWARQNNIAVPARGRIPAQVREQYMGRAA